MFCDAARNQTKPMTIRDSIVFIHSLLGVSVFASGLLQILLKKGGLLHQRIGQFYLFAWLFLLLTGAYIGGPLITLVGVFGFYFALTGARIGRLKNRPLAIFEKGIFTLGALVALAMLYHSVGLYRAGDTSFGIIFAVFGALFALTTTEDIFKYILKKPFKKDVYGKSDWYFEHFTRMSISFIAAVTAFTSVQNVFRNNTLNFLMPTLIGIVLIRLAKQAYKKKFRIGSGSPSTVEHTNEAP